MSREGRPRVSGAIQNPEEGFLTGIELERVESLLRERSAEMTRTRSAVQLHPSMDDAPVPETVVDAPPAVVEVSDEGVCADCGDRISAARLKAVPDAKRCVSCQRALESQTG
jgi:RNA polymerase-binding transcription factor